MARSDVARSVRSLVRQDEEPLDLTGYTEEQRTSILFRHGALMRVKRLTRNGYGLDDVIREPGMSRPSYFDWAKRFRRSRGNPASLLSMSRAWKTPPKRVAWAPKVEYFVMMACNDWMVNAKDLAYCYALWHPDDPPVSWRPMARILATLRDEKGLIDAAERGKKPLKNGRKRVCAHVWSERLAGPARVV